MTPLETACKCVARRQPVRSCLHRHHSACVTPHAAQQIIVADAPYVAKIVLSHWIIRVAICLLPSGRAAEFHRLGALKPLLPTFVVTYQFACDATVFQVMTQCRRNTSVEATDNVLVAIMNNRLDFALARDQGWYRIPVAQASRLIKHHWPPAWLAFYHTQVFEAERHAIHHYAPIKDIRIVRREELFPNQPRDERSQAAYYQLLLGPLQTLATPIRSPRLRRITFIPTLGHKFTTATEINDLFNDSPLEDIKRYGIQADRQEIIETPSGIYTPDFIIPCAQAKLVIEADGDTWHANPKRAARDNVRDNAFKTAGWQLVRFNGMQIREQLTSYCLPTIEQVINRLGGVSEGQVLRLVNLQAPQGTYQMSLFND